MARKKRVWYPGATYHVMSRGNRRGAIFKETLDYIEFLELIRLMMERYPFRIHSICLMTNHFHMALETAGTELWRIMQKVLSIYAESFNHRYAHTAAIKSGGYTIAVLGNGPDICYPKEHRPLYERIAQEGCILSEYPPGREPQKYAFPNRNRVIAALSDELHVTECGKRSGTESTIKACRKWGRAVIQKEIQKDFTPN